jgi:hypothetical protein
MQDTGQDRWDKRGRRAAGLQRTAGSGLTDKRRLIMQTTGSTVSPVSAGDGISSSRLFNGRSLMEQGEFETLGTHELMLSASELKQLRVRYVPSRAQCSFGISRCGPDRVRQVGRSASAPAPSAPPRACSCPANTRTHAAQSTTPTRARSKKGWLGFSIAGPKRA